MGQIVLRIGKKGAIYIPKRVMSEMNIREGDPAILRIEGSKVIIEIVPNPFDLALKVKKWAKTTVEKFEEESETMQSELYEA